MTPAEQRPLTARQREVLDAVRGYLRDHGYAPTVRELAERLGVTKTAAFLQLETLRRKGALTHTPGASRTLRVVEGGPA